MDTSILSSLSQTARGLLFTLNSPQSPPAVIKTSSEGLSSLSKSLSPPQAFFLAQTLLQTPNNQLNHPITNYAFHLLNTRILSHSPYVELPEDFRFAVRGMSTDLLKSLGLGRPAYFERPVVTLYANLGVREWPQSWPNWLTPLLSVSRGAVGCAVIAELSDAVHVYSGVGITRKQQLRSALAKSLKTMLPFVIECATRSHSMGADGVPSLKQCLRCITSLVGWANLGELFEAGIATACLQLLHNPIIRNDALAALDVLVAREVDPGKGANDAIFRSLFESVLRGVAGSEWINLSGVVDANGVVVDKDMHQFRLRLYAMLSTFGVKHFVSCFFYTRRGVVRLSARETQCPSNYIQLMLAPLLSHSTQLRTTALSFFSAVLSALVKQEKHETPLLPTLILGIVHGCGRALIRWPNDRYTEAFRKAEYEEKALHLADTKTNVVRACNLLVMVGKLHPQTLAELAFAKVLELLQKRGSVFKNNIANGTRGGSEGVIVTDGTGLGWKYGEIRDKLVWQACFEASCYYADALAMGVKDSSDASAKERLMGCMKRGFDQIASASNHELGNLQAEALRLFTVLYVMDAKALDTCVDILGGMITAGEKGRARHRACTVLSTLFKRMSLSNARNAHIGSYAANLSVYCGNALKGGDFGNTEKIHLLDATLSSALMLEDVAAKVQYVETMTRPLIEVLSNQKLGNILASPVTWFDFLNDGPYHEVSSILDAFTLLEVSSHQVVRPAAKSNNPIPLPGILSRSVAPRCVDIACAVITCLHSLNNRNKFPFNDRTGARRSALQPTSHELTVLLNLDASKEIEGHETHGPVNGSESDRRPTLRELRSMKVLDSRSVEPAEEEFAWIRETLHDLWRSSYELLRAAILSGVTHSQAHLQPMLMAVCTDIESLEPSHLNMIIQRCLKPLFCYNVTATNPAYLLTVASSQIPHLLHHIRDHIVAVQYGKQMFSESNILDISRNHGRFLILRTVADMLVMIYPRVDPVTNVLKFFPDVFRTGQLGNELRLLWYTICNPSFKILDGGAARVCLLLVSTAVSMAPDTDFSFFGPLLVSSIRTCVLQRYDDSATSNAISAILCILRKWPVESEAALHESLGKGSEAGQWSTEMIREVVNSPKPKKHRVIVRSFMEKLAKLEGVTREALVKVDALPDVGKQEKKKTIRKEDLLLGDHAIESLFGAGDPL